MTLIIPESLHIPVGVLVERRPSVTRWAETVWRVVAVLEEIPPLAPWARMREEEGRCVFFAGSAEIALYPTDTDNYLRSLQQEPPRLWVVLRPTAAEPGYRVQTVTVDAGEAECYTDAGADLVECLPMPAWLKPIVEGFVAQHHRQRHFYKRRRDRANVEALGRRPRVEGP